MDARGDRCVAPGVARRLQLVLADPAELGDERALRRVADEQGGYADGMRRELLELRIELPLAAVAPEVPPLVRDREGQMDVLGRRAAVRHEREGPVTCPDVEPSLPVIGHVEGEHRRNGLPEPPARREISDAEPEMIDRWPANAVSEPCAGLHAVSVGVDEEPAVVVRVVLRARARLTVARITRVDACLPERVDFLA